MIKKMKIASTFLFLTIGFLVSFTNVYAINSVSLDKDSYEFGETVKIRYVSDIATSVNFDLYNYKGQFVSSIATNIPVVTGLNEIQYNIPAIGPNNTDDLFVIRIKEVSSTRITKTIKFYILPSYMQVTRESSNVHTLLVPNNPDRGIFIQTLKVKAVKGDVFLRKSELVDYTIISGIPNNEIRTAGIYRRILTPVMATPQNNTVYVVPQGREALVEFTLIASPLYNSDTIRFKLNSISTSSANGASTARWYKGMQDVVSQPLFVVSEASQGF